MASILLLLLLLLLPEGKTKAASCVQLLFADV
jgi:hypothetical protein